MRMLQVVRRPWSALVLVAGLTACGGGDSNGPSAPYDAAGTSGDLAAANAAFDGPEMQSFAAASVYMQQVVGGPPAATIGAAALRLGRSSSPEAGAKAYAQLLRSTVATGGDRPQFSSAAIPSELLGTTFVLTEVTGGYAYVASNRAGAPSNGVRFILYPVNPLSGEPGLEVEIGYADLITTSGPNSGTAHLTVVDWDGVTYLDYTASYSATTSGARITTTGFVANGTDRANFTLSNLITTTATGATIQTDWAYDMPNRGFSLDFGMTFTLGESEELNVLLDLRASGPHGTVTMTGNITDAGGTLTVKTAGTTYAVITSTGTGQSSITGPAGEPLSETDLEAVGDLLDIYEVSFDGFGELLWPALLFGA